MQPTNKETLLEAAKGLISIPSTLHDPDALRRAIDFMVALIWDACPDVTIERFESDGTPSLLAYRGDVRPDRFHIILNGHADVVPGKPEQYNAVVSDGKLYGRGAYDMKAACVVLASVFCEYANKVPYALGLQIVADEEDNGEHGTRYQIERGVRADFVICGECGRAPGTYEIANQAKGFVLADIEFDGKSAHSAYPWRGDNPILKASRFFHALHECYPVPTVQSDATLVSITELSSNSTARNQIPDHATVKLNARYAPGDPNFKNQESFIEFIKGLDPDAEILMHDFGSPIYTSPHNPLLLELKAAAESVEGKSFNFVQRHGTGDGRFYGDVGNEACEFGIAGENPHSDNEYVTLEAFHNYLETMRAFLEGTIGSDEILQRSGEMQSV